MSFWYLALIGAGLFCFARGAVDLRRRRFVWGILGIASGLVIVLLPVPTQAVKIDLPIHDRR